MCGILNSPWTLAQESGTHVWSVTENVVSDGIQMQHEHKYGMCKNCKEGTLDSRGGVGQHAFLMHHGKVHRTNFRLPLLFQTHTFLSLFLSPYRSSSPLSYTVKEANANNCKSG